MLNIIQQAGTKLYLEDGTYIGTGSELVNEINKLLAEVVIANTPKKK